MELDIVKAKDVLDEDHYGLTKIKDRILEYLSVRKLNPDSKGPILCFAGPPGVGKTSLARSVATATGREYVRLSLGGVRDEAEIRGHRRTYVGAMPGKIIMALKRAKSSNPLFCLDEIDKMSSDYRGDPASALLEVLDPEQNKTFNDHYLDIDYDLSKVFFITTANSLHNIPAPLQDRMEIIELSSYLEVEKKHIARDFLLPRQIKEHGLKPGNISLPEETLTEVIRSYTREAGVRSLEREIGALCRKTAIKLVEEDNLDQCVTITPEALETYLGTEEAYRSARLSLVSEVAQAYLALVADRERLNIATETLKSQQASYEMIARRHSVGVSSELDLRQAQTSVDTARVDIARYSGQVAKDITALSLLAGTKVTPDMLPAKALSELPVWPDIPVSLPSTVLLQRPDILQAEHTLKAANADIGAARANFFPRISLTANIGTASNELSHLFDGGTGIWTFLPQVSLPIFEGGRNVANLRVSEADEHGNY